MLLLPRRAMVYYNFSVNFKNKSQRVVNRVVWVFIIVITIFDKCVSGSKKINENEGFDSSLIRNDFNTPHVKHNKENVALTAYQVKRGPNVSILNNSSMSLKVDKRLSAMEKLSNISVLSSPHRSSQLGTLLDLLSQHSSEVALNKNDVESTKKDRSNFMDSFDGFDKLKSNTNVSDPYYDDPYIRSIYDILNPTPYNLSSCASLSNTSRHRYFDDTTNKP